MIAVKSTNDLFCDLHDLQRAGVMVDTRLILDDGELSIHWPLLDLYGDQQWWSGLGKAGGDNVIILPGVTVSEAQQFVDILYGVRKVGNTVKSPPKSRNFFFRVVIKWFCHYPRLG